ncbi:MAG: hypothetical protein HKN25_15960, partial [Pyrinomonadaceae bacterium]|nr:hypothetical protein [Pyrinomonadaceae bacterium]
MWKVKTILKAISLVKQQFLFLILFLIAATSLIWIKKQDEKYHGDKQAPILVVGKQGDQKAGDGTPANRSVNQIQGLIAPDLDRDSRLSGILNLALLDFEPREIKDVSELTGGLTQKLKQQKESRQEFLLGKIDDAFRDSADAKTSVLLEFQRRTRNEPQVQVGTLISELETSAKAQAATQRNAFVRFNNQIPFNAQSELINVLKPLDEVQAGAINREALFNKISENFRHRKSEVAIRGYKNELKDLSSSYETVSGLVSGSGERLTDDIIGSKTGWPAIANMILDDSGELNILYRLVNIILTFIVIFSLLYVIIQPITRIFFLSEYTTLLSQRLQDSLASGGPASLPQTAATTAVTAISAVGIGAVAIGGGQFDHVKSRDDKPTVLAT